MKRKIVVALIAAALAVSASGCESQQERQHRRDVRGLACAMQGYDRYSSEWAECVRAGDHG